jgi:hypothetical protein
MLRYLVLGMIVLASSDAWAQQPAPAEAPVSSSPPLAVQPSKAVVPMEQPLAGDHWTYEIRDEITGKIAATRTHLVTEVTPRQISIRVDTLGKSDPGGQIVYDRSWNVTVSGLWKYSPHDGAGIQPPLEVGKSWNFRGSENNASGGFIWNRSGKSKVIAQEMVTTKAGTFETFKIETSMSRKSVKDPTRKGEATAVTWYAPAVDHWVKRTFVVRVDNHLLTNNTIELTEYGRKQ